MVSLPYLNLSLKEVYELSDFIGQLKMIGKPVVSEDNFLDIPEKLKKRKKLLESSNLA